MKRKPWVGAIILWLHPEEGPTPGVVTEIKEELSTIRVFPLWPHGVYVDLSPDEWMWPEESPPVELDDT